MPQLLDPGPGGLARHIAGRAGPRGDLAVGGHGVLHGHIGRLGLDVVEKDGVEIVALRPQEILLHRESGFAQQRRAPAADLRVGIAGADDHLADAGL